MNDQIACLIYDQVKLFYYFIENTFANGSFLVGNEPTKLFHKEGKQVSFGKYCQTSFKVNV
jgi:hypothetical protein